MTDILKMIYAFKSCTPREYKDFQWKWLYAERAKLEVSKWVESYQIIVVPYCCEIIKYTLRSIPRSRTYRAEDRR